MAARALLRNPGLAGPQPSHHTFFAERTHFARGASWPARFPAAPLPLHHHRDPPDQVRLPRGSGLHWGGGGVQRRAV